MTAQLAYDLLSGEDRAFFHASFPHAQVLNSYDAIIPEGALIVSPRTLARARKNGDKLTRIVTEAVGMSLSETGNVWSLIYFVEDANLRTSYGRQEIRHADGRLEVFDPMTVRPEQVSRLGVPTPAQLVVDIQWID